MNLLPWRALLAVAFALLGGPAAACLICIDLPERTIADRLVEAEIIAFAREDPARPYSYAPTALLRGEAPPSIPFLVDSATHRRLAADRRTPCSWPTSRDRPDAARLREPEAAKQLIRAQDWSQADTFADLLASGAVDDPAAEFVISVYLEAAQEAIGPILPAADWSLE